MLSTRDPGTRTLVSSTPRCPLCGGTRYGRLWRTDEYAFWRCAGCGLVRRQLLGPQPDFYDAPEYFAGYLRDRHKFRAIFQELLDTVERYRRPPGLLLDVGCGVGLLLECARERGWSVRGVEVSAWASEQARRAGFDVQTGDAFTATVPPATFDVIVLNHVLEHVAEPLAVVTRLAGWLRPGGVLAIGTPNFGSPMAMIEREDWPALMPLEHVWQFTPRTLARLVRRAGLEPVAPVTTAMQPRNYRKHPKDWVKRWLYAALARLNQAETMLMVTRKPCSG